MSLTSQRNPILQDIRKAIRAGRATEQGWLVAEGPNLLAEARRSPCVIERVLITPAAFERCHELVTGLSADIVQVSERALNSVSGMQATQGIITVLRPPRWTWADLTARNPALVLLDGIQDPGNAGTIARSAEAFGATGLVFLEGSVRVSNGKLLRASAGSLFRIPFLEGVSRSDLLRELKNSRTKLYALASDAGMAFTEASFSGPFALATGAEGAGISEDVARRAEMISIPTSRVESLNAAVACSLALFEAWRQRR